MNRATAASTRQCGLFRIPIQVRLVSRFMQEPECGPRGRWVPRCHLWLGIAIAASWLVAAAIAIAGQGSVDAPAIYVDDWDAIRFH